jgi:hypothetical protein
MGPDAGKARGGAKAGRLDGTDALSPFSMYKPPRGIKNRRVSEPAVDAPDMLCVPNGRLA